MTRTSKTPLRYPIPFRNILGSGAANGRQDALKPRLSGDDRKGAEIPASETPERRLEPEVAASCPAPFQAGGSRGFLGKAGVDFGLLYA